MNVIFISPGYGPSLMFGAVTTVLCVSDDGRNDGDGGGVLFCYVLMVLLYFALYILYLDVNLLIFIRISMVAVFVMLLP